MDEYAGGDRRPIASRELGVFKGMAAGLARAGVSANGISVFGMVIGVAAGGLLVATGRVDAAVARWLFLAAAGGIQLRLLANMLDGMVAIASGKASAVGELFNEIPDRISDTAILVGAGYAAGGDAALGWAAACVALFVTYVRAVGKGVGVPGLFMGPMSKSHRMALLTVACVYAAAMPAGWQWRWFLGEREFGVMSTALAVVIVLGLLTAVRRILRIVRDPGAWLMEDATRERLFDITNAFGHPASRLVIIGLAGILLASPVVILLLDAVKKLDAKLKKDLWERYWSWLILGPMLFGPMLLGAACVMAGVCVLSLACYREFARATGQFRQPLVSAFVVLGILAITAAVADHWYGIFVAIPPLTVGIMAAAAILADEPKGYIQRLALGIFAFLLFGVCFGHLGYFANDARYRPILFWLVAGVEMNDLFAYITGKLIGGPKLAPHTSPNKTVGGAVGALVCTTAVSAWLGHIAFHGTNADKPMHLILLGVIVSVAGQFGDLTLSSIKRDLGIKDWANTFPGHGGLLDRCNSLLFAAPAVFHYVGYIQGIGLDQTRRIFF